MVYGDAMDALWGRIVAAPAENVRILQDNECVRVGDLEIAAWDTPGHARHHHAYVIGGCCFTGDVAGVRLESSDYLSVAAAPPQFDPAEYVRSVDRLLGGAFSELRLAHFGLVDGPSAHLTAYRERIQSVATFASTSFAAGEDEAAYRQAYARHEREIALKNGVADDLWARYELANSTSMCADGARLFARKSAAQ